MVLFPGNEMEINVSRISLGNLDIMYLMFYSERTMVVWRLTK